MVLDEENAMRKIAAGLFVSVDGVVEGPDTWTGPYFSPELGQLIESMMGDGDTLLLGRVTYQGFAAAFGGQSGGMADRMNSFPKVVVFNDAGPGRLAELDPDWRQRRRGDHQAQAAARPEHQHERQRHPGHLAAARGPAGPA